MIACSSAIFKVPDDVMHLGYVACVKWTSILFGIRNSCYPKFCYPMENRGAMECKLLEGL